MEATCQINDCNRPHFRRGLCAAHVTRLARHGILGGPIGPRKHKDITGIEWIRANADHAGDECLIWPFGKFANGYGQVCVDKTNKVASREMCTAAHGEPVGDRIEAAHSCGNGHLGCVNPRHLRWATKTENEADKKLHRQQRAAIAA